jgi:hypothetical protein
MVNELVSLSKRNKIRAHSFLRNVEAALLFFFYLHEHQGAFASLLSFACAICMAWSVLSQIPTLPSRPTSTSF